MTTFAIEGAAVRGIPSLYEEFNRVFMADADWRMGQSLDALNDVLYGVAAGSTVIWRDHDESRRALGRETTVAYYRDKLRHPEIFDTETFRERLAAVEAGAGPTYFDLVLEVFDEHPGIELLFS